jgi:hypothetical protein
VTRLSAGLFDCSRGTLGRQTRPLALPPQKVHQYGCTPALSLRTIFRDVIRASSTPSERRTDREIVGALPNARVELLPGQGHAAMHTSPELFSDWWERPLGRAPLSTGFSHGVCHALTDHSAEAVRGR